MLEIELNFIFWTPTSSFNEFESVVEGPLGLTSTSDDASLEVKAEEKQLVYDVPQTWGTQRGLLS